MDPRARVKKERRLAIGFFNLLLILLIGMMILSGGWESLPFFNRPAVQAVPMDVRP